MKILNYGENVVCFRDYEVQSGTKVFLEAEIKRGERTHQVYLIPKYDHSECANATANFDGTTLELTNFSSGSPRTTPFETVRTRLKDIEAILADQVVIKELKARMNRRN